MTAPLQEQIDALQKIQQEIWAKHHLHSIITIGLGDVATLRLGALSPKAVEIVAVSGYDVWRDGDLDQPDVSSAEATHNLIGAASGLA